VITWGFFLLVARFLFLVHDNKAQIFKRSEHGRPRSYHDPSFAAAHAPPFARAFHFGKRAVKYGNARANPSAADPPHQSVKAISGTRINAVLLRARAASTAPKYTSVLPLPVTRRAVPLGRRPLQAIL